MDSDVEELSSDEVDSKVEDQYIYPVSKQSDSEKQDEADEYSDSREHMDTESSNYINK